jgi:exodeoxyribonuclease VII large subunit
LSTAPLFEALFEEEERRPLTVSELTSDVRTVLERRFSSVWVEGEVVNFTAHGNGHWYFTLNDKQAQVRAVCFRSTNFRIRFRPQNGMTVRVRGRITVYPQRGEYQLCVDSLEPSGEGAMRLAFEQIKARLAAEGLFDHARKKEIPYYPRRVGVITSPTGAAYFDILNVLTRRAKCVSILLIPALVQGERAAASVRSAVELANAFQRSAPDDCKMDVLIVGRGGGSMEDLWPFNDEGLARAIAASRIPVISAVGHEIDTTIADLVADMRAATPSAAAEIVAECESSIVETMHLREQQIRHLVGHKLECLRSEVSAGSTRLNTAVSTVFDRSRSHFSAADSKLSISPLRSRVQLLNSKLDGCTSNALHAAAKMVGKADHNLNVAMSRLNALSPLAVLTRGYSITQTTSGEILRDPLQTSAGERLEITLEKGKLKAEVLPS